MSNYNRRDELIEIFSNTMQRIGVPENIAKKNAHKLIPYANQKYQYIDYDEERKCLRLSKDKYAQKFDGTRRGE